jgi:hypothetical protein
MLPMKSWPSPLPDELQESLAKTSIRNFVLARLFRLKETLDAVTPVITGKF